MDPNILEQILEGSVTPTKVPFETLSRITDGFSRDRIIGEGGFGTIYKGLIGNRNVAVKRFKSNATTYLKFFSREFESLMEANHENVVRFLGLCSHTVEEPVFIAELGKYTLVEKRERLFCFEYISNGSLDHKISDEFRGLEWDTRYQIIIGICKGLHYLHEKKHILHMDLKPANILLDNHMVPKITNFGLSRPADKSQTTTKNFFSSPGYGAPENEFGQGRRTKMSDLYSLGIIIIELVTGHRGIPDNNTNILRRWIHRWNKLGRDMNRLKYHLEVTKCIEIGLLCRKADPYARPSIYEIMRGFDEVGRLTNDCMNGNESTDDQINPLWEDDMLDVEPLDLQFSHSGYDEHQQPILSCYVELSNNTDGSIAFKIRTTSLFQYSIQPDMDILKSRFKCSVHITLSFANSHDYEAALEYSTNKEYSEEFHVQSIEVNEDLTVKHLNEDMFDKHIVAHNIDEVRLVVVSFNKEVVDFPTKIEKRQYTSLDDSSIQSGTTHIHVNGNESIIGPHILGQLPQSKHSSAHIHANDEKPIGAPLNSGPSTLPKPTIIFKCLADDSFIESDTTDIHVTDKDPNIAPPNSGDACVRLDTTNNGGNDEEPFIALPSSAETNPGVIEPGSVQLVVKNNNNKAPLSEYHKKVMLELTCGNCSSDRPGLDLVAVLDVGVNTRGKMEQLKSAMLFVVGKLRHIDRLSIVSFSYAATVLWPLQFITEASRTELQRVIRGMKDFGRASNMKEGLMAGLKVLAGRKGSTGGRVVAIMLMSDGQQSKGDTSQVNVENVAVYTFGLGAHSDSRVLSVIAGKSRGGTYSHVQDKDIIGGGGGGGGGLTLAFSQCLAGLLTVSVRDLELTVAAVGDKSTSTVVLKVTAGTYPQMQDDGDSVTVSFGDLYGREVRNIIVDLRLPRIDRECSAQYLKITYSYSSRSSAQRLHFVVPPKTLTVRRLKVLEEEEPVAELQIEEARLQMTKMIKEARSMLGASFSWITPSELAKAQRKLVEAQKMLEDVAVQDPLLRMELLELLELLKTEDTCDEGLSYALSSESSHGRQRYTVRGGYIDNMRLFATQRMDKYLEQAKKFLDDPTVLRPSSAEDEEVDVATGHGYEDSELRNTGRTTPIPMIQPGTVHLAIKLNKKAPRLACGKKVLLELTGGDWTSDRPGLDLVVVLDVHGDQMEHLLMALRFLVRMLSPVDRLSVVTISGTATKVSPLQQVTEEASWPELKQFIHRGLKETRGGANNIKDGLLAALNVLDDSKVSRDGVVGIMLMSDGRRSKAGSNPPTTEVSPAGNVPVYTFGLGADTDHLLLSSVAANSIGGTFSYVQDITDGGLTLACSECLAGLLTVSVRDLELTVAPIGDESRILNVTAGSYPQQMIHGSGSVTVKLGNLYSMEVRRVMVHLLLPAIESTRTADILKVTYSYINWRPTWRPDFSAPPGTLTVWRSGVEVSAEEQKPKELQGEEARLYAVARIKDARSLADWMMMEKAVRELSRGRDMLDKHKHGNMMLPLTEMAQLFQRFQNQETYKKQGNPYVLSLESSHDRQRHAARGLGLGLGLGCKESMRSLYATPHMHMYREQANKFLHDQTMSLSSPAAAADQDVDEEIAHLTIDVSSDEEAQQPLRRPRRAYHTKTARRYR